MEAKIVKITAKGQISIPISIRELVGIERGDEVIMVETNGKIIMEKVKESNFRDLLKNSEGVAEKLWSNKEDDVWDTV